MNDNYIKQNKGLGFCNACQTCVDVNIYSRCEDCGSDDIDILIEPRSELFTEES